MQNTPTRLVWGTFTEDFAAACPQLPVASLTAPQADVIYLHDFSAVTCSYRAIGLLFNVFASTVKRHHDRGWRRLETAGARTVATKPATSRMCSICDVPWQDCRTCLEMRIMPAAVAPVRSRRGYRAPLDFGHCSSDPATCGMDCGNCRSRHPKRQAAAPLAKRVPTVQEASSWQLDTVVNLQQFAEHHARGEDWPMKGRPPGIDTGNAGLCMQGEDPDWSPLGE